MTTKKKDYVKPAMTVIEVEPQQMICTSGTEYNRGEADDMDPFIGEFD